MGIPGWFGFEAWYDRIADECPPGSTLVELGVFCGKSLAYLAAKVKHKGCRVVGVDTFRGSPEFSEMVVSDDGTQWPQMPLGHLAAECMRHLNAAGVLDAVTLLVADSAKAAEFFADSSVYSVFVDADHRAEAVERDARAWWPKVVPSGYLAGDDYAANFPGVREGLLRVFAPEMLPPEPPEGVCYVWGLKKT